MSEYFYGFKLPKTLFEMTWEEAQEALKETDLVVLPIGSTEQHGPHLPLGNDAIQVREMARRIVVKLAEKQVKAVAGPLVPFGVCSYHMPFPGTINLQPATFQALMYDVMISLYRHGFRRFALPLGHGGNLASMHVVAQKFMDDTQGTEVVVMNWLQMVTRHYKDILASKKNEGHSGEPETSRLLACHPELVEMKRARPYYSVAADKAESADHPLMGGGIFKPERSWKDSAPWGSVGDPTLAKAETGEKIWELICGWMTEVILRDLT